MRFEASIHGAELKDDKINKKIKDSKVKMNKKQEEAIKKAQKEATKRIRQRYGRR